ncbi:MAG: M36 family metallopeptidase [Myxococcota bacterium]
MRSGLRVQRAGGGTRQRWSRRVLIAFSVGLLLTPLGPAAAGTVRGILSGPSARDPLEIALDALEGAAGRRRSAPPSAWWVTDRYVSRSTGLTHLYLREMLGGLEIENESRCLAVTPDGRLLGLLPRDQSSAPRRPPATVPQLDAVQAVQLAAGPLGLAAVETPRLLAQGSGPAREGVVDAPGLSRDPIPVRLVYRAQADGTLRLAWSLVLRPPDPPAWWKVSVDARNGAMLSRVSWVAEASYRVFAPPLTSPAAGSASLERDAWDPIASPLGWHDDGSGASTTTIGNNAVVQEDRDADDMGGFRPEGGAGLDFDFAYDPLGAPLDNLSAALTQVFYWTSYLHDVFWRHGFDEAAGAFQTTGFSGEGLDNDPVFVDVQDGERRNNATMATPPDGTGPVLQLHLFDFPALRIERPASVAGLYAAGLAHFGPLLASPVAAPLVRALDPTDAQGPSPYDACSPLTNPPELVGRVALVDRGSCLFTIKVRNAQEAGAVGVVVLNREDEEIPLMQGSDPSIEIPSLIIGRSDGETIEAALDEGLRARLEVAVRDSGFDDTILVHEYGHGVSSRLTGGPGNASCLATGQAAATSEGWSDFWALLFTARPGGRPEQPRGIAEYLVGPPGLRRHPYSTDPSRSPRRFADVRTALQPHGAGEVWAVTLWELYWLLVRDLGFDPDLTRSESGNGTALRLGIEALALQPCEPSFLDARDALLLADAALHEGAHHCRIWQAFTRRGMGVGAADGGSSLSLDVVESFELPAECSCGDLNGDGRIDAGDVLAVRTRLADPDAPSAVGEALCAARAMSGSCGLLEATLLRRALAGRTPGLRASCAAAAGP